MAFRAAPQQSSSKLGSAFGLRLNPSIMGFHLSLGGFTPEHVYRTGCPVDKLWKNYYPHYQDIDAFD